MFNNLKYKIMLFLDFFVFIKKHLILFIIWIFLFVMVCYSVIINWINRDFEVSCNKLIFLINKKNAVVIDVREAVDYHAGSIIDSINIPFTHIDSGDYRVSSKKFENKPVIIVGDRIKSLHLTRKYLNKLGFLEVYVLKGGLNKWKDNDFPLLSKK